MTSIYVLKLQDDKYYVGKTDCKNNILEYFTDSNSDWIKKYPPISIIKKYAIKNDFCIDYYTLLTMKNHEIDNVRGGSFQNIELKNAEKIKALNLMKSCFNRCFKCNVKGHTDEECEKIQMMNNPIEFEKFIRIKLGQTIFPTPDCNEYENPCNICIKIHTSEIICKNEKCYNYYHNYWKKHGHLRFNFHACDDKIINDNNNKILDLFSEFYKDKKCIIKSYKGVVYIQVVSSFNSKKYDYMSEENKFYESCYHAKYPYIAILHYSGRGTVEIIQDLIMQFNRDSFVKTDICFFIELGKKKK